MHFVLIFDADNTLWDTNAVFSAAQVALLDVFENAGILTNARHRVQELRALDRALMLRLECHEYDFHLLATAVAYHYHYAFTPATAVAYAVEQRAHMEHASLRPVIEDACGAYVETLGQIPPLLPGVRETLSTLCACRTTPASLATVIFSEGNHLRLERIIAAYNIREQGYFNEIVIGPKTAQAFQHAGATGQRYLPATQSQEVVTVVIGDSLERDIRHAKAAGFTTIYIPGAFKGREIPQSDLDRPDFQLESMLALPSVLTELGLPHG
jgi:putative hydrolase of the HAD superfamily